VDEVDSSSRGLEGSSRRKNPKPQRSVLTGFLKNFGTSSSNGTTAGYDLQQIESLFASYRFSMH
jgi:hypothetical protein